MEEKERNILERNQELLVRNVILTDEFYGLLERHHVLPATMLADVKAGKSQIERNLRLLETLKIRGGGSYKKLRHILSLTGHAFLADHLYEEDTETRLLKADDIFAKFQSVFNHVSDDVKTRLLRYLETKLREKMLKKRWSSSPQERSEILDTRNMDYEMEKSLTYRLETKKRQVEDLEQQLTVFQNDVRERNTQIDILKREIEDSERKFKDELRVQSRFNAANNNSILRLKDKFSVFNTRIQHINRMIHQYLGDDEIGLDNDPETGKISLLEHNVRLLIDKAKEQNASVNVVSSERDAVLRLLKRSPSKHETLQEAVRKFIDKENKAKISVIKEIEKLNEALKDKPCKSVPGPSNSHSVPEFKVLKTMTATIRVEVEHMRKKLQWKDAQINDLVQEIANLRQKQISLSKSPTSSRPPPSRGSKFTMSPVPPSPPSSPESTHDMQMAYEKLDEYLHEEELMEQQTESKTQKRVSSEYQLKEKVTIAQDHNGKRLSLPDVRMTQLQQQGFFERDNLHISVPAPKPTPCDWMSLVVNDNDNMEIEDMASLMANGKLPPIPTLHTASYVDMGNIRSNIPTEQIL